jgi:hypothetical protein
MALRLMLKASLQSLVWVWSHRCCRRREHGPVAAGQQDLIERLEQRDPRSIEAGLCKLANTGVGGLNVVARLGWAPPCG